MHKLVLHNEYELADTTLKKILKCKFTSLKSVNNLIRKNHKFYLQSHNVSKEAIDAYTSMSSIYQALDNDFGKCDWLDYEYYERWLNG